VSAALFGGKTVATVPPRGKIAAGVAADAPGRVQLGKTGWEVLIARKGVLARGDAAKLQAPFEKMRANIARITEANERERWEANRDMWRVVIGRATAGELEAALQKRLLRGDRPPQVRQGCST
jgi:hypothetical protein